MKNLRDELNSVPKELFTEIDQLLQKYGVQDVEVTMLKIQDSHFEKAACGPGQRMFCYYDRNGKKRCRCIDV